MPIIAVVACCALALAETQHQLGGLAANPRPRPALQRSAAIPPVHPFLADSVSADEDGVVHHAGLRPQWLTSWLKATRGVAYVAPKAFHVWSATWTATILIAMGLSHGGRVQLKLFDGTQTVLQTAHHILSYKEHKPSIYDKIYDVFQGFFDRNFVILMTALWVPGGVAHAKACGLKSMLKQTWTKVKWFCFGPALLPGGIVGVITSLDWIVSVSKLPAGDALQRYFVIPFGLTYASFLAPLYIDLVYMWRYYWRTDEGRERRRMSLERKGQTSPSM